MTIEKNGKYRTAAGIVLQVTTNDGTRLDCQKIQSVGGVPQYADTHGEYAPCIASYDADTNDLIALRTADGKPIATVSPQNTTKNTPTGTPQTAHVHTDDAPHGHRCALRDINAMRMPDAAAAYSNMGFILIAAEPKSKKPVGKGWNAPENNRPPEFWRENPTHNIGCIAARNRLIFVDIDDTAAWRIVCDAIRPMMMQCGVERPFWESGTAEISSHTQNHAKLVFRVPDTEREQLQYRRIIWERDDGNTKNHATIVEFRCTDDMQDILPPSIHPSGTRYEWCGGDDIIQMPPDLAHLMRNWDQYAGIMIGANPDGKTTKNTTPATAAKNVNSANRVVFCPPGITPDQFAEWKRQNTAVDICIRNGYTPTPDRKRLQKPGSKHIPGVIIMDRGDKVYSFHAGDPLGDGKPHDAYDCMLTLECGGDHRAAGTQIRNEMGKSQMTEQNTPPIAPPIVPPIAPQCSTSNTAKLTDIADYIAANSDNWIYVGKNGAPTMDAATWRMIWQSRTHMALDNTAARLGVVWYDGQKWNKCPATEFTAALNRSTANIRNLVRPSGTRDLTEIAALRSQYCAYDPKYEAEKRHIHFADGAILNITDAAAMDIQPADPAADIWFSALGVPSDVIDRDLDTVGFDVLCARYPRYQRMMDACDTGRDRDGGRTMIRTYATIVGSAIYAFWAGQEHPSPDTIAWLYDANVARTGKTTHMRLVMDALGSYAAQINMADLVGAYPHTGNLDGCALAWAEEASDCRFHDRGTIKALVSGQGTIRRMYNEPMALKNPIVFVATANGAPRIPPSDFTDDMQRRLLVREYTVQHPVDSNHQCPTAEAHAAIINIGLWQCIRMIRAVHAGKNPRDAWVCTWSDDDIDRMQDWVDWVSTLETMVYPRERHDIPVSTLRRTLIAQLVHDGRIPDDIPVDAIRSKNSLALQKYRLPNVLKSDLNLWRALRNRNLEIRVDGYEQATKIPQTYRCASIKRNDGNTKLLFIRGFGFRTGVDVITAADA